MSATLANSQDRLESAVEQFEATWRSGGRPQIEVVLSRNEALAPTLHVGAQARDALLVELVAVDLEYRWKSNNRRGPLLEQYVKRLPQLGALDDLPAELIAEEYRVRHRFGDRPPHPEYTARFPRHGQALSAALADVDDDLRNEYGEASAGIDSRDAAVETRPTDAAAIIELDYHDYAIRRLLGRGGMSRVYTAVQKSTGQAVALKILNKPLIHSRRASRRFVREARIAGEFDDHGLVNAYGTGRLPDGGYFMAMRLVHGMNLHYVESQLVLTVDESAACVARIAQLVELVHLYGYLHCDLKPSNVLVDSQGDIWLTDFAMAQPIAARDRTHDDASALGGTYAYMAPEQLAGDASLLSRASDVFALGGIFYYLLTGEPPRSSSTLAAAKDSLGSIDTAKLHDVPERIRRTVARCLETDPSRRFQTAIELADALSKRREQSLM